MVLDVEAELLEDDFNPGRERFTKLSIVQVIKFLFLVKRGVSVDTDTSFYPHAHILNNCGICSRLVFQTGHAHTSSLFQRIRVGSSPVQAEAVVSSTFWAAATRSRITSIVALGTRNDGALPLFQEIFLDCSGHVCTSLLCQRRHLPRCLKVSGPRQSKCQVSRWEPSHRNTTPNPGTVAVCRVCIYHKTKFSKHFKTQQNGSYFTGNDVCCKTLLPRARAWYPDPGL